MDRNSLLGPYLKDRRSKMDPSALGFSGARRRTPGLRREEVAQRANISPTWYTCLEQGRGGAPSANVLDRIAGALLLTNVEREHLFMLGLGRAPDIRYHRNETVTPRLQRVLDVLDPCPALIRTATWDVVAWNRAVRVMFTDYAALPPGERNILRSLFLDPRSRHMQYDWESTAQIVVSAFRLDSARAGAAADSEPLVEELRRKSPDFDRLWRDNTLRTHGDAVKHMRHPVLGRIAFEYSAFAVDGRPDLIMTIYNPASADDLERIESLLKTAT